MLYSDGVLVHNFLDGMDMKIYILYSSLYLTYLLNSDRSFKQFIHNIKKLL